MQEEPTPVTMDPMRLLAFLDRLVTARTVIDVNVAAGILSNELRGIDED